MSEVLINLLCAAAGAFLSVVLFWLGRIYDTADTIVHFYGLIVSLYEEVEIDLQNGGADASRFLFFECLKLAPLLPQTTRYHSFFEDISPIVRWLLAKKDLPSEQVKEHIAHLRERKKVLEYHYRPSPIFLLNSLASDLLNRPAKIQKETKV